MLIIEGYEAGKHPLVCKYVKGVFNINSSLPKNTFTWDVEKVINYLGNRWIYKLKNLSERTITLLSILCGQRSREVITAMDTGNITFEENHFIIRIGNLLKTFNKKHHTGEVKFSLFPSNKNITVYYLTKYLDATKPRRDNITSLFITKLKLISYKSTSKDHVAPWIKATLAAAAGIDVKLFTPHSTHFASNGKTKLHVPIETILKTGGGAVCIHLSNIMINQ